MTNFGQLLRLDARSIWQKEAHNFTPWLVDNIQMLGKALGMDLVVEQREADVGEFSLDILAKNLSTGRPVIIENQLGATDHDHFGKLLTYAAGFDASDIIWIATTIREEHRQALEWLNQNTSSERNFFAVQMEVLQIDESKPALNFNPLVFPNEWQKANRQKSSMLTTKREQRYQEFFQKLIDELREKHRFTNARIGQPQGWYSFSSGHSQFSYSASFAMGGRVRAEVYIDAEDKEHSKAIFDSLQSQKQSIEKSFSEALEWERIDEKSASRIAVYRTGSIQDSDQRLDEIRVWMIQKLIKLKSVFGPVFVALKTSELPQR